MDIESNPSKGCGWSSSKNANCAYVAALVMAAAARNVSVGIYSSNYEWTLVAGTACTKSPLPGVPLWYAGYATPPQPSCKDFKPFGWWSAPFAHQFADHAVVVPPSCKLPPADSSVVC